MTGDSISASVLKTLLERYPVLAACSGKIVEAYAMLRDSIRQGGTVFVCGNGGSHADADHIIGELSKGFLSRRVVPEEIVRQFTENLGEDASGLCSGLQMGIRAMLLSAHPALSSAYANDVDPLMCYAQQLFVAGRNGDVVIGLSTSGNAEKIIGSIPQDRPIVFLPDRNLGGNMMKKLGREMELWPGCCPIHDQVTVEMIRRARAAAPGAPVLVHPECRVEVVDEADEALSTAGILRFCRESSGKRFIIGTEQGILHRLRRENPGKEFLPLEPAMVCCDMKKVTLEDLHRSLRDMTERIELDPELAAAAVCPIRRMLDVK